MSNTQHTQGPWRWQPSVNGARALIYGAKDVLVGCIYSSNPRDALLIVAAPDTLAVLELARAALLECAGLKNALVDAAIVAADVAIAKATTGGK